MEYLFGFASSISRDLVCGAVDQLRYPCCFNNFVEDLAKEKANLVTTRDSVQDRVAHAKKQTRKTALVVDKWLNDANTDIDNVNKLLEKATTKEKMVLVLYTVQIGSGDTIWEGSWQRRNVILKRAFKKELMNALKDDEVTMIGLYGMGGLWENNVGNGSNEESKSSLEQVLFVPVSNTVEVQRIQEKIASSLEFEFQEKHEMDRSQRLCMRLTQEDRILVILDDVWEMLDFDAIGIPSKEHHKGCKVLITTRSETMCVSMNCQKMIHLSTLTNDETWEIFQKHALISEGTSFSVKHLAREISNECKGLPVAIVAVASSLKGKAEVEWKVALNRLRSSKPVNIEKGLQNPYKCLQLSYDNLDMEEAKALFLLCSAFPEDYEIPVEILTRSAIGLGIVGEVHSYEEGRNEVSAAQNKLISCCLLLDVDDRKCVKMHDLVRNVAHWIAENENKVIKCELENDATLEHSSLKYLWCEKFPHDLDCSNLEFLHMHTYSEVSDEIFKGMRMLRVLLLYNKDRERRPLLTMSLKLLTNLRCILLSKWELGDISFVGDIKKLESLTLCDCSFLELPDVVTQVTNLRLLDLSECDMKRNPFEVIRRHPQLEELYFADRRSKWDNGYTTEFFKKFSVPQVLQRYQIQLGTTFAGFQEEFLNHHRALFLSYLDPSNAAVRNLAKKAEVLCIAGIEGDAKNIIPGIFELEEGSMNHLIELLIRDSEEIEYLVDTSNHLSELRFAQNLAQLEKLEILSCPSLRHILTDDNREEISTDDHSHRQCTHRDQVAGQSENELKTELSALEELTLINLPNINSICPEDCYLTWPSLRQFSLQNCPEFFMVSINTCMALHNNQIINEASHLTVKNIKEVRVNNCELEGIFQLAGLPIDEEQDPLKSCLETLYLENLPQLRRPTSTKRTEDRNCNQLDHIIEDMGTAIPSASTAKTLTTLEELTIQNCHGLKHLLSYGKAQQNKKEDIVQNDHDLYMPMFPSLKRLSIMRCHLLQYILPISFARGLVKLEAIEITETPELRYVFGQNIRSSHQYQNKFQIELPVLEKVTLYSTPNMIAICPENCHATCSSLQLLVMNEGGLSINNLMVDSGAMHSDHSSKTDEGETSMAIEKKLVSIIIENSSKIEGIFYLKGFPVNGQQVTSWLEDLKLVNLPELMHIWMGAKHFVRLQHLHKLHIYNCPKLKAIFSASILRILPLLKILVVEQCEKLEQIIEDEEENDNVQNPQSPKVCFSQLKFLCVTHCNNLKHLFYISNSYEFPELEYLILNQDSCLVQVFKAEPGVKEGRVEVLFPKLKHVMLTHLPSLNNICQGIEFQTLTNLLVHNCPKLSLTPSTTVQDMLQTSDPDKEIEFYLRPHLYDISGIIRNGHKFLASKKENNETRDLESQEQKLPPIPLPNLTEELVGTQSESMDEPCLMNQQKPLGESSGISLSQTETDTDKGSEGHPIDSEDFVATDLTFIGLFQSLEEYSEGQIPTPSPCVSKLAAEHPSTKDNLVAKALADLEESLKMPLKDIANSEANSLHLLTALNFLSHLPLEDIALTEGLKAIIESMHKEFPSILCSFKQAFATMDKCAMTEAHQNEVVSTLASKISKAKDFLDEAQQKEAILKEQIIRLKKEIKDREADLSLLQEEKKKCIEETIKYKKEFENVSKDKTQMVEDQRKARQELFEVDYKWSALCSQFQHNGIVAGNQSWSKPTLLQSAWRIQMKTAEAMHTQYTTHYNLSFED
ncbi:P-loop containing nucleoside triphosphate hydrolase [Sesbania bispinosa]|nr:P-loop containing nucleoside triphosphate hydrolase [Sesbania bispinosa]